MGNRLSGIGCVGCEGRSGARPVALVTEGAGIGIVAPASLTDDPGLGVVGVVDDVGDDMGSDRKLRELEEQKQAAVAIEDYDTAKLIKAEMDRLRCAAENPQAPPQRPPSALAAAPQSAGTGYEAQEGVAPDIQHGPKAEVEMGSICVGPEDTGAADITNTPGPGAGDDTDVGEGRGEEDEQDGGGGVAAASSPAEPSIPGSSTASPVAEPAGEPTVSGWLVYVPDDHGKFLLCYTKGVPGYDRPSVATGDIIAQFGPTETVPPFKITGKPTELKKHVDQNKLYYEGFCTFLTVAVKMRCSFLEVFNDNVPPNRPQVAVIFLEGDGLMESKHRVVKFGGASLPGEPRRWEGDGGDIHFVGTISYMDNTFDNLQEMVKDVFFKLCTTRGGCAIKVKS